MRGKFAGEWLLQDVAGKPCNVVELQGTVGSSVAINRKKGFADGIASAPGVKIIRSQSGDFTRSKGKEVMESFIKAEQNGKIFARSMRTMTIWRLELFRQLKKQV